MSKTTRSDQLSEEIVELAEALAEEVRETSSHIREITTAVITLFADSKGSFLTERVTHSAKAVRQHYRSEGVLSNDCPAKERQIAVGVSRAEDILHGARRIALGKRSYDDVLTEINRKRAVRRQTHLEQRSTKRRPIRASVPA